MRIQCKGCGKEYQVDERRLTQKGVRVKCRTCGAVLMIRLRQGEKSSLDKTEEAAPPLHEENPLTPPVTEPKPSPFPYRFCIDCGKRLDSMIPIEQRPVCKACKTREHAKEPAGPDEHLQKVSPSSSWKRLLLFAVILMVILLAAFLGYRLASGQFLTFDILHRHAADLSLGLVLSGYGDDCIDLDYAKSEDLAPIPGAP